MEQHTGRLPREVLPPDAGGSAAADCGQAELDTRRDRHQTGSGVRIGETNAAGDIAMGWIRRLRNTIVDRPLQEEFDAEARAYFDERVREGIRRGLTRVEAEMDARRDLGNLALARDEARDA